MSEPTESPDVLQEDYSIQPVPVRVIESEEQAAEFGGWTTYILTGTEPAQQILRQRPKRHRAVIWCLPGFTNNNTSGNVYLGTQEQVQRATPGVGGIIVSGMSVVVESQSELWCQPDGTNSLTLVVLDEGYR